MKSAVQKAWRSVLAFLADERGSLDKFVVLIGLAVVAVAVIFLLLQLAPNTAADIWSRFMNYATSTFGI